MRKGRKKKINKEVKEDAVIEERKSRTKWQYYGRGKESVPT
jgi:hypothetical protein